MLRRLVTTLLTIGATCAAATAALAQGAGYQIGAGDTLAIEVLEDPSLNRSVLVLPDGRITFPLAGTIQAGGRTVDQVSNQITTDIAPNFATEPTVFVSVANLAPEEEVLPQQQPEVIPPQGVYFIGEVAQPGEIQIRDNTTLLQALAQAGGLTRFAAAKRIQLRRTVGGQERVYRIDYEAIRSGAVRSGPIQVQRGDVIIVPERRLFE